MEQKALVLCDPEMDYAQQMASFLEKDHEFPWKVIVCTGIGELRQVLKDSAVEILVLAESMASDTLPKYPIKKLVLLNESGHIRFSEVKNIDKYQEADNVRKALLKLFAEQKTHIYPKLERNNMAECIAFYSPIRRCLQTSTAITYGQLLAERGRVLYLNFEYYAHYSASMDGETDMDMTSLLYHIDAEEDEFALHVRTMRRAIGNWDYIIPMCNGENLPGVEAGDWLKLLGRCRTLQEYDFIVLDLNDSIQGLPDVLRQCDRIYTIVKDDNIACEKMKRYEYLLDKKGYEDICQKTSRLLLPEFIRLPAELEDYSRGELADYVRRKLRMEESHGIYGVETETAE